MQWAVSPLKTAQSSKGKLCALQRNSNINSTVHITYQLVGRSMFLHGVYHFFVQGRQCFLVEPAVPVKMSESFMNAIIIFSCCFAEGPFWPLQPVWHWWFFMGVELLVGMGEALWFPVEESSPWVTVRFLFRPAGFPGPTSIQGINTERLSSQRMSKQGWRFHKSNKLQQQNEAAIPLLICPHACFGAHVKWFVVMG